MSHLRPIKLYHAEHALLFSLSNFKPSELESRAFDTKKKESQKKRGGRAIKIFDVKEDAIKPNGELSGVRRYNLIAV